MNNSELIRFDQPVALVTGATGFVGCNLVRRLVHDGWRVHILKRSDSKLPDFPEFERITDRVHDGSTQNMVDHVAQAKPDVVFHLASLFISQHATNDVDSLILSNVLFGNQLLEAMKVNGVSRLINTGTSWQHYNNEDYNPVCLYAATKQAFESILTYYVQAEGLNVITLKLFDTYGPADPRLKLFKLLNDAAKSGEPLNMSAGEQLIDIVYIDDVIDAYVIAANRLLEGGGLTHESYMISSERLLPLKDLVALFSEITEQDVVVNWGARPYRSREVMVPWNCGNTLAGWSPKIKLEDGLIQIASMPC